MFAWGSASGYPSLQIIPLTRRQESSQIKAKGFRQCFKERFFSNTSSAHMKGVPADCLQRGTAMCCNSLFGMFFIRSPLAIEATPLDHCRPHHSVKLRLVWRWGEPFNAYKCSLTLERNRLPVIEIMPTFETRGHLRPWLASD